MDLEQKKEKLKSEIDIARKMLRKNALSFKPTAYIFPESKDINGISSKALNQPLELIVKFIPMISSLSQSKKQSSWISYLSNLILQYIKL